MGKYLRIPHWSRASDGSTRDLGPRGRPLYKAGRPACPVLQPLSERDAMKWHGTVLEHLRGGDHAAALPLLGRLALLLPRAHRARPGVLASLAHVLCELRRFERALAVAGEALRLDPNLREAADTARRARRAIRP